MFDDETLDKEYAFITEVNQRYEDTGYELQRKRLESLLAYAVESVPAYARCNASDFSSFPVITKQIVRDSYESFLSRDFDPSRCYKKHTSGSTGYPFPFYQDKTCRTALTASLKYWNHRVGVSEGKRILKLCDSKGIPKASSGDCYLDEKNNLLYVWAASFDKQSLDRICSIIRSGDISAVRGYMSSIDIITRYAVDNHISLRPHSAEDKDIVFISGGEPLLKSVRSRIEQDLGCIAVSQYATEEMGVLGSTVPGSKSNGIMELDSALHYMEVLKRDADEPADIGEMGRLVLTDLTNKAMPLIRYDIGDLVIPSSIHCGCPRSISHIAGRATDLIYCTNGTAIDFLSSKPLEIYDNESISQWQFIQKSTKSYALVLQPTEPGLVLPVSTIKDGLRKLLGIDACINIQIVNEIGLLPSGKRRMVINEFTATTPQQK